MSSSQLLLGLVLAAAFLFGCISTSQVDVSNSTPCNTTNSTMGSVTPLAGITQQVIDQNQTNETGSCKYTPPEN